MKKMLTMLFLLFVLGTSNITSNNNTDASSTELAILTEHENLVETLSANIEEFADAAYLDWNSIPILSPIRTSDIIRLSSDYGVRIHPVYNIKIMHKGLDLAGIMNTDIRSTANGKVIRCRRSRYNYGNYIIIEHSNGYSTRYAHLNDIFVSVGDTVQAGDKIGALGTTGLSTGPHLHYEVLKNNTPIDPMFFSYKERLNRNIETYFNLLVVLERTKKLGMYHT